MPASGRLETLDHKNWRLRPPDKLEEGSAAVYAVDSAGHEALHLLDLGGDISGNGKSKLFPTIAAAFAEAGASACDVKKHQAELASTMAASGPSASTLSRRAISASGSERYRARCVWSHEGDAPGWLDLPRHCCSQWASADVGQADPRPRRRLRGPGGLRPSTHDSLREAGATDLANRGPEICLLRPSATVVAANGSPAL